MAPEEYIVRRDSGDWSVSRNGTAVGRFVSCPRAIRAAVEAVEVTPALSGHGVVERSPFDRYVVWVRGQDGYSTDTTAWKSRP